MPSKKMTLATLAIDLNYLSPTHLSGTSTTPQFDAPQSSDKLGVNGEL
jgi:hypothetical protein